jgi:hypothetical protein
MMKLSMPHDGMRVWHDARYQGCFDGNLIDDVCCRPDCAVSQRGKELWRSDLGGLRTPTHCMCEASMHPHQLERALFL